MTSSRAFLIVFFTFSDKIFNSSLVFLVHKPHCGATFPYSNLDFDPNFTPSKISSFDTGHLNMTGNNSLIEYNSNLKKTRSFNLTDLRWLTRVPWWPTYADAWLCMTHLFATLNVNSWKIYFFMLPSKEPWEQVKRAGAGGNAQANCTV